MDKRKDPSSVDIKSILLDMRKYRMGLIQTPDQLRFSYMAVLEGAKCIMGDASVQVTHLCTGNTFSVQVTLGTVKIPGAVWKINDQFVYEESRFFSSGIFGIYSQLFSFLF